MLSTSEYKGSWRRFLKTRKTEVRFGVVKDRKKRFFEVTLAGSGHVTCSYYRGSEGQGRVSTVLRDPRRECLLVAVEAKVRVGVVEDRKKECS